MQATKKEVAGEIEVHGPSGGALISSEDIGRALTLLNRKYADEIKGVSDIAVESGTSAPPFAYFRHFHDAINKAINRLLPPDQWDDEDKLLKIVIVSRELERLPHDLDVARTSKVEKPYKVPRQRLLGRVDLEVAALRSLLPDALRAVAAPTIAGLLAAPEKGHDEE